MNSLVIILVSFAVFFWGYRVYAKRLENLYEIDPARPVPSKTKYDGIDYVPAKNWLVLFGHHFSSIAGAGPIVGPVIACCIWGWSPVLLWVVLGSIFFGAVHDFAALAVSVREGGNSISEIASRVISKRANIIFALFVWLALLLVIAVFVYLCADTFVQEPKIILPSLGLIPVALLVGFLLYNLKANQILSTVSGLILLVLLIVMGQNTFSINLSHNQWSIILLIYCFIASVLPVNLLLQPRDYLSSFLLFFGMITGLLGLIVSQPNIEFPSLITYKPQEGPLWPMLFVSVACGAISGFHCLVSSGTTSKQIANERHIKIIGYGAMLTEGLLAVIVILAISAGIGRECLLDKSSPVLIFGRGFGQITKKILGGYGEFIAVLFLNAFILTTLDTATRINRYISEGLFKIKNRYFSTLVVVVLSGFLALAKDKYNTPLWKKIWPAFGASNQLVAALALFVVSCWLLSKNKPTKITLIPAIFMLITTIAALIYQIVTYLKGRDYLLLIISIILIFLSLAMTLEVINVFRKKRPIA